MSPRRKLKKYLLPRSHRKSTRVRIRIHSSSIRGCTGLSCPADTKFFFPVCLFSVTSTGAHQAWRKSNRPWIPPWVQTVQIVFFWGQSFATCHFRHGGRLKYIIWGVTHHVTRYWLVPTFLLESRSLSCLASSLGSCRSARLQVAWGGWRDILLPFRQQKGEAVNYTNVFPVANCVCPYLCKPHSVFFFSPLPFVVWHSLVALSLWYCLINLSGRDIIAHLAFQVMRCPSLCSTPVGRESIYAWLRDSPRPSSVLLSQKGFQVGAAVHLLFLNITSIPHSSSACQWRK